MDETNDAKASHPPAKRLLPMELRRRRRAAKLQRRSTADDVQSNVEILNDDSNRQELSELEKVSEKEIKNHTRMPQDGKLEQTNPQATIASRMENFLKKSSFTRKKSMSTTKSMLPVIPTHLQTHFLPIDWSPKTKLIFLTPFPFPFFRPSPTVTQRARHLMMGSIGSNSQPTTVISNGDKETNEQLWHNASFYFVHPQQSPAEVDHDNSTPDGSRGNPIFQNSFHSGTGYGSTAGAETNIYGNRWTIWQSAFRDAYYAFREAIRNETKVSTTNYIPCFYIFSSSFVVLFSGQRRVSKSTHQASENCVNNQYTDIPQLLREINTPQAAKTSEMYNEEDKSSNVIQLYAVLTPSSARIRRELKEMDVLYEVPYGTKKSVASDVFNSNDANSLLLFRRHGGVHGLFEFLINNKPNSIQALPQIVSCFPFTHATLVNLKVQHMGMVARSNLDSFINDNTASNALYRTEVTGFCFPHNLQQLLVALCCEAEVYIKNTNELFPAANIQHGDKHDYKILALQVYLKTLPFADRLNIAGIMSNYQVELKTANSKSNKTESDDPKTVIIDQGASIINSSQDDLEYSKRRIENVSATICSVSNGTSLRKHMYEIEFKSS